jgi:hypothetical protein
VTTNVQEILTNRSGIMTSFSSAGPTAFGHRLKPDLAAPGGQILSSTLPEFARSTFAVFDGTSMATPHVAGAAALLVERHRNWSPQQIKSALMSTAGPAWADPARTVEAPVTEEGAGLINVDAADDPDVFTNPVSLSFGDLDVNRGAQRRSLLLEVSDAGDGSGTWNVELHPQSASAGANVGVPTTISLPPGGTAEVPVAVSADAGAAAGDDYGFILLRRGDVVRRVPYLFLVTRPGLESTPNVQPLKTYLRGDTRGGESRANVYRFPTEPFGPPPTYVGQPMDENGSERVYVAHVNDPLVNIGSAVIATSSNAIVEPWFLGALDENSVEGYAGTPVDVNALSPFEYQFDVGAAGVVFPRTKRYYVSVDSGKNQFTGKSYPGRFLLRSWTNDLSPPHVRLITQRVTAGRPMLVARITDAKSGVDPLSLLIAYRRVLLGAAFYDPFTGIALFPMPSRAPTIRIGKTAATIVASDYQEAKNVDQAGTKVLPNTRFDDVTVQGGLSPALAWVQPEGRHCVSGVQRLVVIGSAPARIESVRFFNGGHAIATVKKGTLGLYATDWSAANAKPGLHKLTAVLTDRKGTKASAVRYVRVCGH